MRNRPRSWRYRSASGAALLLVVAGALSAATPASSASTLQVVPGGLGGLACPSATTCLATSGNTLVPITNGVVGTPVPVPGTEGLGVVTCPNATTCVAVGDNALGQGVVVPITSGIPGTAVVVSGATFLSDVACPSATTCVATSRNASDQGVVVPITSGTPSAAVVVSKATFLDGVACSSVTSCVAVGETVLGQGLIVPITNGTPGTAEVESSIQDLGDVACPNPTTCEVVGASLSNQSVVILVTNGILSAPRVVSGTVDLGDVTCPSATTCLATGSVCLGTPCNVFFAPFTPEGVVVPITNGVPGSPVAVPDATTLGSVACTSATTCEAAGQFGGSFNSEFLPPSVGVVVPITNGIPGTAAVAGGKAGLVGGTEGLFDVACPNATTCVAIGPVYFGGGGVDVVLRASSPHVPLSVGECQNGTWQSLGTVSLTNGLGRPFANQGDCIAYLES